jgi:peptidoglycan/LPS O-acetylase OafA/YrhL
MKFEPLIRSKMPELDTIRGIAIFMVLLGHGFFWIADLSKFHGLARIFIAVTQTGGLGVNLFFILSGFLITNILLKSRGESNYFQTFYWRRALRILPAYFALLIILKVLGIAEWPFIILSLFFGGNLAALFGIAMQYGPLWTLAVEEQFYLVWRQVIKRLPLPFAASLAIFIVVGTPILRYLSFTYLPGIDLYYYTWFVSDGLALGALLAIYVLATKAEHTAALKLSIGLLAAGLAIIAIGIPFGILHRTNVVGATLQICPWNLLFAGCLLLILIIGTSPWKRFVNIPWLQYLGYISYSLYLIHFLIFKLFDMLILQISPTTLIFLQETMLGLTLRFIIASGVSIIIAGLSRKYFEQLFLNLKNYSLYDAKEKRHVSNFFGF